jgi:hypothetical protein
MAKRRVVPFEELGDGGDFMQHVDSALSCALVAGAYIENALGSLLVAALIDGATSHNLLNNPKDILSTYSSRADLCYCMGLIPKEVYNNARTIGTIRNRFAHSHVALDFLDEEVVRLCNQLQLMEVRDQTSAVFDSQAECRKRLEPGENAELSLRTNKFIQTVTETHMVIVAAAADIQKRTPEEYQIVALTGGFPIDDAGNRVESDEPSPVVFFTTKKDRPA